MYSGQVFMIIVVVVPIALGLSFGAFINWAQNRRAEREAYYKAETLRRITETPGEGPGRRLNCFVKMSGSRRSKAAKA